VFKDKFGACTGNKSHALNLALRKVEYGLSSCCATLRVLL